MPLGPGSTIDGIYQYGEDTPAGPLFSDYMNLGLATVRTRIAAVISSFLLGDSGWQTLNLINGWTAVSSETPKYRKLNGFVTFQGQASGGSGAVGVLPVGYRPSIITRLVFRSGTSGTTTGVASVAADGTITVTAATLPNFGGFAPYIADA